MKTNRIHLLVAVMTTITATAQDSKPPQDRRPPPVLLLHALDGDRSGELSADEIANASAALAELDKDEDGALSQKEIMSPPPRNPADGAALPPKKPKPSPVLLKALDLDKDRTLSADEIEDAPASLATLDKDEDGTISKAEMKPGKPPIKIEE